MDKELVLHYETLQHLLDCKKMEKYRKYHDYVVRRIKLDGLFLSQTEIQNVIDEKCFHTVLGYKSGSSNIVVSLTCTPPRFWMMPFALCSLFLQDMMPNRIVLTLAREELSEDEVPENIKMFQQFGLEILWTDKNTKRNKKIHPLITMLQDDDYLLFGDDDLYYYPDWVSRLVNGYRINNSPVCFWILRRYNYPISMDKRTYCMENFTWIDSCENDNIEFCTIDPRFIPGSGMGVCFKVKDCIPDIRNFNFCDNLMQNDDEIIIWHCLICNNRRFKRIHFACVDFVDWRHTNRFRYADYKLGISNRNE